MIRHTSLERGAASNTPHVYSGVFHAVFKLTPYRAASEGHISLLDQGNITVELQFDKPISEAITCLLILEYDNYVAIDQISSLSKDL